MKIILLNTLHGLFLKFISSCKTKNLVSQYKNKFKWVIVYVESWSRKYIFFNYIFLNVF